MVWIQVPDDTIISFEKIETIKWRYPDLSVIEIRAKIKDVDYLIYSKRILSEREAQSYHNSLINKISEDGLDEYEISIDKLRMDELDKIFKNIFNYVTTAKPNEILNLNRKIKAQ